MPIAHNENPNAKCTRCGRPCPIGAPFFGQFYIPDPAAKWFVRSWRCGHPELTCGNCFDIVEGCAECGCDEEYT